MNKVLFGLGVGALVLGGIGLTAGSAMAYRGDPSVKGPAYSAERHEAMEKAFETGNYTAWKELMQGRGRVSEVVNKDNFAQFAKAHELAEEGKIAEAQLIRTELGLYGGMGQAQRGQGGMGRHMGR